VDALLPDSLLKKEVTTVSVAAGCNPGEKIVEEARGEEDGSTSWLGSSG